MSGDSEIERDRLSAPAGSGFGRWLVILVTTLLLAALAALGAMHWGAAIFATLAIGVAVLLAPFGRVSNLSPETVSSRPAGLPLGMTAFADALQEPAILIGRKGAVLHRNRAASRQFPTLALGAPIALSVRQPSLLNALEAAERANAPQTTELHQTIPTETWHRVTVAPVATGRDDEFALLLTLTDLTEQRRVDAMRADFIANASHELRTPLTSLIGFIDTLLGPASRDAASRERFLGIMRSQSERMSKLIDDLLSLSRIEMRQHERPTAPIDLVPLSREVVALLAPQVAAAKARIDLQLPEEAVVPGDRDELFEVIENALDNAIKYGGSSGPIQLAVEPVTDRAGFGFRLVVADHGPGVAPEQVPRLTERFYRVEGEGVKARKGTGLGLAIVKHIVARHRGLLTIRSRPGEGLRLEVLLPGRT